MFLPPSEMTGYFIDCSFAAEQKPGILETKSIPFIYMQSDKFTIPNPKHLELWQKLLLGFLIVGLSILAILAAMRIAYNGRLLPGTKAYGIYVGGMTKADAISLLQRETDQYVSSSTIIVNAPGVNPLSVPASEVEVQYSPEAIVDELYKLGRDGQLMNQLSEQTLLLVGAQQLPTGQVSYNPSKLYATIQPAYAALNKPAQNANYAISKTGALVINPEKSGQRLNLAGFISNYEALITNLERGATTIQAKSQDAAIPSSALESKRTALTPFISSPLTLTYNAKTWKIPTAEVLGWLSYSAQQGPEKTDLLNNYYASTRVSRADVDFDSARIGSYLGVIAKDVNQSAVDAKLTISGDRATIFQQSQDGRALDTATTSKTIIENFRASQPASTLPATVVVTKADVNDSNIDRLGIKELLSEGVTYFPGSSANRIVNVRVGSSKFNGVLLKPGQVFSFGQLLGDVGPEQGYKEGRVILEGRQESQYGGGLCQVSSTAFRAALLAGLPILERYNHSFAVSYYTAPYGVPGIDATIYYPQVDFKFRNDTDAHILIQTEMVGTTLKFRFFGTKKKEGAIRGPNFIYGSNDPNQPSKTVFYRDIKVGNTVVKTDTFYTTYKSAADFPAVN